MTDLMSYCEKGLSEGKYSALVDHLINHTPHSWARYGDGEFAAIYHKRGRNASGHQFFTDLGDRLKQILLSSPPYELGLQRNAVRRYKKRILSDFPHVTWSSTEYVHDVSQERGLDDLFLALRDRRVLLVGPEYLNPLSSIFSFEHITVPLIDCWLEHDRVLSEIQRAITPDTVVLFIAAMMSNVLIDELYTPDRTLLDIGAAFDPYVGKLTRGYHRKMVICIPSWAKEVPSCNS